MDSLEPPERLDDEEVTGVLVSQIIVAIHKDPDDDCYYMVLALTDPNTDMSVVYMCSSAYARQLASSILNKADEVDVLNEVVGGL